MPIRVLSVLVAAPLAACSVSQKGPPPGRDVPELPSLAVPGKVTVVEFSAAWCEASRALEEHVTTLAASRSDLAYRKVDIGDGNAPLARNSLAGVESLPYVIVYARSGERIDAIQGVNLARLDEDIAQGAR